MAQRMPALTRAVLIPGLARLALSRVCTPVLLVMVLTAPALASPIASVQLVQICTDAGSGCGAMTFDASEVQAIWAQAGLTIDFLPARTFNSTAFHTMDSEAEVLSLLLATPSPDPAGPAGFLARPITVWFSLSGFSPPGLVSNGVIGGNRAWVASNLSSDVQSLFLAQVLGLNFGLSLRRDEFGNLMRSTPVVGETLLTSDQIATVLSSPFVADVTAVPEPTTVVLLVSGLADVALRRRNVAIRRRTSSEPGECR